VSSLDPSLMFKLAKAVERGVPTTSITVKKDS
jgi:hypothetical protein